MIARALLVCLYVSSSVNAQSTIDIFGLESHSGAISIISPPPSVQNGALPDDDYASFFLEQRDFRIDKCSSLPVDLIAAPGTYSNVSQFVGGTLSGLKTNSYFLHADSTVEFGNPGNDVFNYKGSVSFSDPIVGLVGFSDTFLNTTALQSSGTAYPDRGIQDYEFDADPSSIYGDSITLSDDLRTISFDLKTGGSLDQLRIVTGRPLNPVQAQYSFQGLGTTVWTANAISDESQVDFSRREFAGRKAVAWSLLARRMPKTCQPAGMSSWEVAVVLLALVLLPTVYRRMASTCSQAVEA
jgi:hypothetical protein